LTTNWARSSTVNSWTPPGEEALLPEWRRRDKAHGAGDLPNVHAHPWRDIIGAIKEQRPPAITGKDGRAVVAIIQDVYESGRAGRPVTL
jgi:predicted dehydrogenase